MNYAKHYSGEVAAGSSATHYYLNVDGTATNSYSTSNANVLKEQVIGEAMEDFLKGCGLTNCKYYDEVDGKRVTYLCFDDTQAGKPGVYIVVVTSNIYILAGYRYPTTGIVITHNGTSSNTSQPMRLQSSINPFSATGTTACSYDFYLRICGDVKSAFKITFSAYEKATFSSSGTFSVANLVDKRNNRQLFGYNFGSSVISTLGVVYKDDCCDAIGTTSSQLNSLTADKNYIIKDGYIILVNQHINDRSHLWFVDGYERPTDLTVGSFYEIDGDVYFVVDTYNMVKCTTPTPS